MALPEGKAMGLLFIFLTHPVIKNCYTSIILYEVGVSLDLRYFAMVCSERIFTKEANRLHIRRQ